MTPDEVFERHRALAARLASAYLKKLPSSVDRNEVLTVALGGLWDVALRYADLPEARFIPLAITRIRGAIADDLRHADDFSRYARKTYGSEFKVLSLGIFPNLDALRQLSVTPTIERDLDHQACARWLAKAVPRLPPQQRLVVRKILAGNSQLEISRAIGVSAARVCQVTRSAEAALRDKWQRHLRRR